VEFLKIREGEFLNILKTLLVEVMSINSFPDTVKTSFVPSIFRYTAPAPSGCKEVMFLNKHPEKVKVLKE
jgi:hypothetical protein